MTQLREAAGSGEIVGTAIHGEVERKARYGHRLWVVYRDGSGLWHGERATAASLKRAMLTTGTQMRRDRSCYLIYPDGVSVVGFWWMLNNVRRQHLKGYA